MKVRRQRSLGPDRLAQDRRPGPRRRAVRRRGAELPERVGRDSGIGVRLASSATCRGCGSSALGPIIGWLLYLRVGDVHRRRVVEQHQRHGRARRTRRRRGHLRRPAPTASSRSGSSTRAATSGADPARRPPTACYPTRDPFDLAIVSAAFVGALVGFLWWNAPKAKVFMGDVGSMAIGGVIAAMSILSRTELLAVLIAGVFIIGPGSVILQRLYFKVTRGKRLFLMSPFHHHLEMRGWSEISDRGADVDHRGPARRLGRRAVLRRVALADMSTPPVQSRAWTTSRAGTRTGRACASRCSGSRSPASRPPTPSPSSAPTCSSSPRRRTRSTSGCCPSSARGCGPARSTPCRQELVDFAPEVVVASPGFAPRHPLIEWTHGIGMPRSGATSSSPGGCATRSCAPTARPRTGSS